MILVIFSKHNRKTLFDTKLIKGLILDLLLEKNLQYHLIVDTYNVFVFKLHVQS